MYIIVDRVYRYIVCHIWTTSSTFSYQCLSSCLVSNQPFLRDTTGWVSWKVLRVNEKHLKVYQIYSLRLLNIDKQTKMIRLEWIKWKILEYIYVYIYTRYSLKYILRQMDWMLWQRIYQTSESSWSTNPAIFWVLKLWEVPGASQCLSLRALSVAPKDALIHILPQCMCWERRFLQEAPGHR